MDVNDPTLGFLLHDVARLLKKRFEQHSRGSGLTRSQWQVLAYLAQNEGINQSGLAELLDVEQITLGRILDKLESLALIKRVAHASDRRVWLLYLTPPARPKLTQGRKFGGSTRGSPGWPHQGRAGAISENTSASEDQSDRRMRFAGWQPKTSKQWLIRKTAIPTTTTRK